ncbi:toxin [Microbacterium sp. 4R-513]|uniref:toxin n=1 Tax=Microbacterium sp. 4R-513 TaxID=2567934 RepID=UPI0013E156C3|nr:toxin [Microbacterium sp. 4R-513]QIG38207.1 toxin [Microbacterium sp. 4R-513]
MPLPDRPRRIRVVGVSGSGKSSLAAKVADVLDLPRLELDAVFWDADWTFRDLAEARGIVREFLAAHPHAWVVDGNWLSRLDGMLDPGSPDGPDTVVWLDHPRSVVMRRIIWRTLRRGILRQELWHGNRERPTSWVRLDPDANIMVWSWTQYAPIRGGWRERAEAGWPILRLSGQREVDAWLAQLTTGD